MNLGYYQSLEKDELKKRVAAAKKRHGRNLLILGHYYQQDDVIEFADHQGDSYALAKAGAENKEADIIVFCGVHFMAEASVILARPGQKIYMPDPSAGCPLADMADIEQVEKAWEALLEKSEVRSQKSEEIVPITYINSSAELKAFCGKNGGVVCTSSNANNAFDWALSSMSLRAKRSNPMQNKIFFFPDEHLGRNTANAKGFLRSDMVVWDPLKPNGGIDPGALKEARVILWKGFCHVHTHFTIEHVKEAREKYPGCLVAVHPECTEDVVKASDANGSTSFLKKFVEDAKPQSTIVVGTEINMVNRLARQNQDKKVVPLARSLCPNMFKTSLADLCYTLEEFPEVNRIEVPEFILNDAKLALERMLSLTK
jgi:quinolinate synthase